MRRSSDLIACENKTIAIVIAALNAGGGLAVQKPLESLMFLL